MSYRLVNIDLGLIMLNATSAGVLALNWFSEHLTGVGGFIVMLSVACLNLAKAYRNVKEVNNNVNKGK